HSPLPDLDRVGALLRAAGGSTSVPDTASDEATIAGMVAAISAETAVAAAPQPVEALRAPRGVPLRRRFLRTKIVLGLTVATLLVGGGLAFAGALPNPVQNVASHLLQRVGVHVPDSSTPSTGSPPVGAIVPSPGHPRGEPTEPGNRPTGAGK